MVARVAFVPLPSSPVGYDSPAGVRIVLLYFSWKCLRALRVAAPNFVVSFPGDPAPRIDT